MDKSETVTSETAKRGVVVKADHQGLARGVIRRRPIERFRTSLWAHKAVRSLNGLGVVGLDEMTGLVGRNTDFDVLGRGSVTVMDSGGTTIYPSGTWVPIDLLANSASQFDQPDENSIDIPTQQGPEWTARPFPDTCPIGVGAVTMASKR